MKRERRKYKESFQIGVLGCMAERLKVQLLEKEQSVDIGNLRCDLKNIFCFGT